MTRLHPARVAVLLGAALTFALSVTSPATAAVRSGSAADGIDAQDTRPSLNPVPTYTEVVSSSASYNDQAGTITVSVTFNQPDPAHTLAVRGNLTGPRSCLDSTVQDDPIPTLGFTLGSAPTEDGPARQASFHLGLQGYQGDIDGTATVSADGRTLTGTVTHPAFARRDWRCLAGEDEPDFAVDQFSFYFSGYEPKQLTGATAVAALKAELLRRYGSDVSPPRWIACPREESFPDGIDPEGDDSAPAQLCEFRLHIGGSRWRHGEATVKLVDGDLTIDGFWSTTFSSTMRTCRLRDLHGYGIVDRRLRTDGWVGCKYDNSASLIRDLHYYKPGIAHVGFHGTNRAGFQAAVAFRCRIRTLAGHRRKATCANQLGNRFTYWWRIVHSR